MTPRARLALVVAAVAVLVIAFVAISGSGDDDKSSSTTPAASAPASQTTAPQAPSDTTATTTTAAPAAPAPPVVRVVGGKPQGGIQKLEFAKGDEIRFTVRSDVADEIHVHGYDVMKDVPAGGSVTFDFPGKIDGRFVVELEGRGEQIASLEVTP